MELDSKCGDVSLVDEGGGMGCEWCQRHST